MATLQVYRPATREDGYGDTVVGKPAAHGEPFTGLYAPDNPPEAATAGEVVSAETGTVYVRTTDTLDVLEDDELAVDGVRYHVNGVPRDWAGSLGRQGYAIRVSRVPRR